jgi:DNA-binding NtrC family response regulator
MPPKVPYNRERKYLFRPQSTIGTLLEKRSFNLGKFRGTAMERQTKILITDRNKYIRQFLRRELQKAGFEVATAKTSQEVVIAIYHEKSPDFLILDPDIISGEESFLIEKLKNRLPNIPVILHVFPREDSSLTEMFDAWSTVAKGANSAEQLIRAVRQIQAGGRAKMQKTRKPGEQEGATGSK